MKHLLTFVFIFTCFSLQLFGQDEETKEPRAEETYYHMKGSHSFNLGVGFPNLANTAFQIGEALGFENEGSASPVFTMKYEYGLTDELGIGMHLGYYTAKTPTTEAITEIIETSEIVDVIGDVGCELGIPIPGLECDTVFATESVTTGSTYQRVNATTLAGRFAYHRGNFLGIEKLDMYGSIILGYSFIRRKTIGDADADFERFKAPTFVYYTSAGGRYFFTPALAAYAEIGYGSLTVANVGLTYRIIPKSKK